MASTAFFCLMGTAAFSQQTINVSSHTAKINGMTFDYSIGEMTLVSTERNAHLIVTQGLLQPGTVNNGNTPTVAQGAMSLNDQVKVYPNPTENILFVESIENADHEISYQLFDAAGRTILNEKTNWQAGVNKLSLDLRHYAAGAYYLMLRKPNTQGELENFSYKIQKTN